MIDWDGLVIGPATAVFGEPALFQPVGGVAFAITGVFDESYLEMLTVDGLEGANLVNVRPVLGVQLSQFAVMPRQDDVVTILRTGVDYWLNEVRDDGHGAARLLLGLAPARTA